MEKSKSAGSDTSSKSSKIQTSGNRILLSGGYSVSIRDFEFYRELLEMVIPDIEPGKKTSLKNLFGKKFFEEEFPDGKQRQLIGRCVARMVILNLVALRFVNKKTKYPLEYELK